jgi:hypothetical protein
MPTTFIAGKFCHRRIYLTSGFARLSHCFFKLLLHAVQPIKESTDGGPLRFELLLVRFFMPERIQKPVEPAPWGPKQGDGGGPRSPDVSRPDTKDLLKKMRKVDPNQSKRYRQRTGQ